MSRFRLYQLVRVRRLLSQHRNDLSSGRLPVIGDVGTIVDAYSQPHEAYTVECVLADGASAWLCDFRPDELEPV